MSFKNALDSKIKELSAKTAPTKQTNILTNDHEHVLWEKGCLWDSTLKQLLNTTKTIENQLKSL